VNNCQSRSSYLCSSSRSPCIRRAIDGNCVQNASTRKYLDVLLLNCATPWSGQIVVRELTNDATSYAAANCSWHREMSVVARTSLSHPLQIATVQAGKGMGRIGLTFCPGKVQASAFTGAWERDLHIDLDAIKAWGAAAVVTLLEPHEMAGLKVEALGEAVAARHMRWFHLPIRDVSVPDAGFERAWKDAGADLRTILQRGGDVLVHCKGGLGRAGMITARLLVELGWDPAQAIAEVRRV